MRKSFIKKLIKQAIQEQEMGMDSPGISNGNVPRSVRYIDPLTKFNVDDANNFHLLPHNEKLELIKKLRHRRKTK